MSPQRRHQGPPSRIPPILTARWRPAVLTAADVALAAYATVVMAFIRAYDYGTGTDNSAALSVVENAAPLSVWSVLFAVGGVLLLAGLQLRRHFLVWLGHGLLAVLYSALFAGLLWASVGTPWGDGIRSAGVLILPVVAHWGFTIRTGPEPLTPSRAVPVAHVVAAGDEDDG